MTKGSSLHAIHSFVPAPIRALAWRLPWVRSTEAYQQAPVRTLLRAARFTIAEVAGSEQLLRTPQGLAFATMPNNFSSFALFVGGARDPLIWRFIRRRLGPGAVFVDVGANIGAYSLPAAQLVGPSGRIVAIEAHPITFKYLERNVAMNGLQQVTLLNYAMGATVGHTTMAFNSTNPGETHVAQDGAGLKVPLTTVDAALTERGITRVDYLKIDVEGFELAVLQGAAGTIAANPGIVVQTELQEQHASRYGYRIGDVEALLRGFGLEPHAVDHEGRLYAPLDGLPGDTIWLRR